jgi:hypothetical protein
MTGSIKKDRAYKAVADAEPFLKPSFEFRKLFTSVWPVDEFIHRSHRDWGKWVVYIETQFESDENKEPAIVALTLAVNRIELPSCYQEHLVEAMQKYLVHGYDMENAFFGFKEKLSFGKRWRNRYRYRFYFYAMLMAQMLPGHSAAKQLESMIEIQDRDKQESIYRYFSAWKKSDVGRAVARMYENA